MEEQISASQVPQQPQGISPEQLEAMKTYAREQAIRMSFQQQPTSSQPAQPAFLSAPSMPPTPETLIPKMPRAPEPAYDFSAPKVIYVRRNLTVAEILAICVISCVVVGGIQGVWNFASKYIPQIEVRVK